MLYYLRKNYWARQVGIGVVGASLAGYFAFYAIQGDRGMMSLVRDRHRLVEAKARLDSVRSDREILERRVQGMRGQSLDLDLVDEVARKVLNLSRQKDMVVHLPETADHKQQDSEK